MGAGWAVTPPILFAMGPSRGVASSHLGRARTLGELTLAMAAALRAAAPGGTRPASCYSARGRPRARATPRTMTAPASGIAARPPVWRAHSLLGFSALSAATACRRQRRHRRRRRQRRHRRRRRRPARRRRRRRPLQCAPCRRRATAGRTRRCHRLAPSRALFLQAQLRQLSRTLFLS